MKRTNAATCYTPPRRYIAAALLLVLTIWIIASDSGPDLDLLRSHAGDLKFGNTQDLSPRDKFIQQALRNDIYTSEYNGSAVQKLCREAQWRNDRVISCDKMAGGIGNLRTDLLACTRYAIEAGAILIAPVVHPREAFEKMEDSFGWDTDLPLSYLFDSDNYFTRLAEDCPQLRIIPDGNDPDNIDFVLPSRNDSYPINPKSLIPAWLGHILEEPAKWRSALDAHIEHAIIKAYNLPEPSSKHPIRLSFDDNIIFSWPVAYDPDDFRESWGHLALFPGPIRQLAARTLYNLYTQIGAQTQSPAAPSTGAFLGAHIRTESDAAVYDWTSYETQSEHIREQLVAHNLSVVYVATGTADDVERLRNDVAEMRISVNGSYTAGVRVFHKWDLVDEEDAAVLNGLTWDQMALVDMDVMLRASRFVGIWESSWGWMISLKRHAWGKTDPYDYKAHPITYEDELSILYGPTGAQAIISPCSWL